MGFGAHLPLIDLGASITASGGLISPPKTDPTVELEI